jgi:hypothetical protein
MNEIYVALDWKLSISSSSEWPIEKERLVAWHLVLLYPLPGANEEKQRQNLFLNNQPDTHTIQIYSVIKLYMFRASSLPSIRSFLLYIRHW